MTQKRISLFKLNPMRLLLISVFLIASSGKAQILQPLGMEGTGFVHKITLDGNAAYTATLDGQIHAYDISGDRPLLLSRTRCLDYVRDLAVCNGYLFSAEGPAGLCVYDVTTPEHINRVAQLDREALVSGYDDDPYDFEVMHVARTGNALVVYIRQDYGGWGISRILDISSPSYPVVLDTPPLGPAEVLFAENSNVFVAYNNEIQIYDLSSPGAPSHLSSLELPDPTRPEIRDLTVWGNILYVLYGRKIQPLDISDPSNPDLMTASVASRPLHMIASENSLYILTNTGVETWDLSNVEDLARKNGVEVPGWLQDFAVQGNRILVAGGNAGISRILHFNSEVSSILGHLETDFNCRRVSQTDNTAILLGSDGEIQLADISDLEHPVPLGYLKIDAENPEMAVWHQTLLVADGQEKVVFIDISNPDAPEETGEYRPLSSSDSDLVPLNVQLSGDYAVVFPRTDYYTHEIHVLNMADQGGPAFTVRYDQWYWQSMYESTFPVVKDNFLMLFDKSTEMFCLINIEDPVNPVLETSFNSWFYGTNGPENPTIEFPCLAFSNIDNNWNGQTTMVDISNPGAPACILHSDFIGQSTDIILNGNFLTMAPLWENHVDRFNVTPGDKVLLTGQVNVPSPVMDLDGQDPVLIAAGESGFYIAELSQESPFALTGQAGGSLSITGMDVHDNLAITAHYEEGIGVVSLLDPQHPAVIGVWNPHESFNDVATLSNTAYAVGEMGLQCIDISEPSNPTPGNRLSKQKVRDEPFWIAASEQTAATLTDYGTLNIVDITDNATPELASQLFNLTYLNPFWMGSSIVLPGESYGLAIVDAANPSVPVLSIEEYYGHEGLFFPTFGAGKDDTVWLSDGRVVDAVDIANPASPGYISSSDQLLGYSRAVCLTGDHLLSVNNLSDAYASGYCVVSSLDISDATSPVIEQELTLHLWKDNITTDWKEPSFVAAIDHTESAAAILAWKDAPLSTVRYNNVNRRTWIPHIEWTPWWNSFLVVDNHGTESSEIAIHTFEDGSALPIEEWTVAAGEQTVIPLSQGDCGFVASDFADENLIFREVFISHEDGICEFLLDSQASPEIILSFPEIARDQLTWRGLAIMNVEKTPTNARLQAMDNTGQSLAETTVEIDGYEKTVGYLQDYFPGIDPGAISRVTITGGKHLTALRISGHSNSQLLFTPSVNNFEPVSGRYYLTHIANEWEQWDNGLELNNRNGEDVDVQMLLFASSTIVVDETITIPAGQTIHWNLNQYAELGPECGFLDILKDNVMVRQSYRNTVENGIAEFVLIPGSSAELEFLFPGYADDRLSWKGIALQNVTAAPDTVQLEAYGSGGQLASTAIEVGAHDRIAQTLEELFPGVSGIERITATGNRAYTGLNISGMGHERLLFVPAVPVQTE